MSVPPFTVEYVDAAPVKFNVPATIRGSNAQRTRAAERAAVALLMFKVVIVCVLAVAVVGYRRVIHIYDTGAGVTSSRIKVMLLRLLIVPELVSVPLI